MARLAKHGIDPTPPANSEWTLTKTPDRGDQRRMRSQINLICAAADPMSRRSPSEQNNKAGICAGAQRLRLLSVTGFPVSRRPRPTESESTVPD